MAWNIFDDDASASDDDIVANGYAWHDMNARTDPDIIPDGNGVGVF